MKQLDAKDILEKVRAQGSKIFSVRFIKKDGSIRDINCRLHVKKGVKGVGMNYDPLERGLLPVFDMQKDAFRMINLKTVICLTLSGEVYQVK